MRYCSTPLSREVVTAAVPMREAMIGVAHRRAEHQCNVIDMVLAAIGERR